jgi:hypothetical protein
MRVKAMPGAQKHTTVSSGRFVYATRRLWLMAKAKNGGINGGMNFILEQWLATVSMRYAQYVIAARTIP